MVRATFSKGRHLILETSDDSNSVVITQKHHRCHFHFDRYKFLVQNFCNLLLKSVAVINFTWDVHEDGVQ